MLLVWFIVENTLDREESQLIVFIALAKLKSFSMNVKVLFLFFSFVVLSMKESEACCCSWHPFFDRCECNFFGCNCDYNGDGYCYYVKLYSGDDKCHNFFDEKCADYDTKAMTWKFHSNRIFICWIIPMTILNIRTNIAHIGLALSWIMNIVKGHRL